VTDVIIGHNGTEQVTFSPQMPQRSPSYPAA